MAKKTSSLNILSFYIHNTLNANSKFSKDSELELINELTRVPFQYMKKIVAKVFNVPKLVANASPLIEKENILGITVKLHAKIRTNKYQTELDDCKSNFKADKESHLLLLHQQMRISMKFLIDRLNEVVIFQQDESSNTINSIKPIQEDQRILLLSTYQISKFIIDADGKNIFENELWEVVKTLPSLLTTFQRKFAENINLEGYLDDISYRGKTAILYDGDISYSIDFSKIPGAKKIFREIQGRDHLVSLFCSFYPDLLGLIKSKKVIYKLIEKPKIASLQHELLE